MELNRARGDASARHARRRFVRGEEPFDLVGLKVEAIMHSGHGRIRPEQDRTGVDNSEQTEQSNDCFPIIQNARSKVNTYSDEFAGARERIVSKTSVGCGASGRNGFVMFGMWSIRVRSA